MPNYYRFEQQFFQYFQNLERNIKAMPLYLGAGSGAGGTIVGQLPQIRVSYDYEELATNTTSGAPSLLDNLNHIRYDIETLQDAYLSGSGSGAGLTQGHIIYDEEIELTQREKLTLSGAGVTIVDNESNDSTDIFLESVLSFPELTDTPSGSYVTESGKYIKVNSDGTELEYGTPPVWGNTILRLDGEGEVTEQYDADEPGLRSALDDSASGDVILLPPKTITIVNDGIIANGTGALVVPDGVCIKGMDREKTVIYADISTATASSRCLIFMEGSSDLDNLTVNYTRSTNAGHLAYAIYRTIDSGSNTGVTFADVTVVATGVRVSGVHAQIYNDSNKIRVPVDNCCFMVYGGAGSLNKLKGYSSTGREPIIIRDSVFYTDDSSVESGTTSVTIYGLKVESNSYVDNKIILENCRTYSHITDPFNEYIYTRSYGLFGSDFNYTLNNCTSFAISDSDCSYAGALGINITNYSTLGGKINDCIAIATSNATLIGNETTDYVTYPTYGLSPGSSIVEGGYFEGIDNNVGKALGIHLSLSDAYIYNTVAKGDDGDIYIYRANYVYLYGCQYDTITKHSAPPSGSQTVVYLQGDRSAYGVEDYHASDIENDILTRHLPLPTISGYVAVSTGSKWILDQVSGAGGGVDTFLELTDAPSSYVGEGNKIIAVKNTEDGLEFIVQSGAGSGAGASTLLELTDTPSLYTGEIGKVLVVNETEDGMEFTTMSGAGASEFIELIDTPSSYAGQAGKSVVVASGETGLEFTAISGAGGASDFVDLGDTPSSYSGEGNKYLVVSNEEDAVGFTNLPADLISGAGTDKYIAVFNGPTSIAGDSGLQWDGTILTINSGLIVNEVGDDVDSRFEGSTDENLWYLDAGNNRIGIGTPSPAHSLDIQQVWGALRVKSTTATNMAQIYASNAAGGGTQIAKEGSAGGHALTGSIPYASILATSGNYPLQYGIDNVIVSTWYKDHRIGFGLVPTANMEGLSIEAGLLTLKERATPTADANYGKIYTKDDNDLYFQDGEGVEHNVSSGAGGGVDTFLELTDTPADYTDQAGKYTIVNESEDALEFVTLSGYVDTLLELNDTPATYSGASGQSLVVTSGEDGIEFVTISGGGGVETFLELTDTPADYTDQAGKVVVVNVGEDALEFVEPSSGGSVSTLLIFTALHAELPATNFATFDTRNLHAVLDFDDTTDESAIFSAILPRSYAEGGLKVWIHFCMETATSDNVIWNVAFERIGEVLDIDGDSFAAAQSSGAITVPGTCGLVEMSSISFTDGAQIDSLEAGEGFRMMVTRDATTDTAADDAEILYIEIEAI